MTNNDASYPQEWDNPISVMAKCTTKQKIDTYKRLLSTQSVFIRPIDLEEVEVEFIRDCWRHYKNTEKAFRKLYSTKTDLFSDEEQSKLDEDRRYLELRRRMFQPVSIHRGLPRHSFVRLISEEHCIQIARIEKEFLFWVSKPDEELLKIHQVNVENNWVLCTKHFQ
jgi:hypothetical protein